jgi:hypothetical protein
MTTWPSHQTPDEWSTTGAVAWRTASDIPTMAGYVPPTVASRTAAEFDTPASTAARQPGVSPPVKPRSVARISTAHTPASTQLTSVPSMKSTRCPVGNSDPVVPPAKSVKVICTGAALPLTPAIVWNELAKAPSSRPR